MRLHHLLAPALFLTAITTPALSQAPVYGIRHGPPEIWSVDLVTGTASFVGSQSTTMVALARHPQSGLLYTVSNVGINPLFTYDPATGVETQIHPGINRQWHRMECAADGTLYGVPLNSNALYRIDPDTGVPTSLGGMRFVDTAGDRGDMAFAPGATDHFYYFAGQKFYRVDIATVTGTYRGFSNISPTGLAFTEDGTLYASDDWNLYTVDMSNGQGTTVGSFGMGQILDLSSSLSPMFLQVDPDVVSAGDTTILTVRDGEPGRRALVALVDVNGVPMFNVLFRSSFDGAGRVDVNATVPAVSGLTTTLIAFGWASDGRFLLTNTETVTVQ